MPRAQALASSPSRPVSAPPDDALPRDAPDTVPYDAPDTVPYERTVDRLLSGIAGFYLCEHQARSKAEQIRLEYGLKDTQLVLLSPRDAPRTQFSRLAGLWYDHWPADRQSIIDRRLSLALLAVAALLLATWTILLGSDEEALVSQASMLAWLVGPLGLGLLATWLLRRQYIRPHVRRFESRVRQQLGLGHWALVVCKLNWAQQSGVLALLRAGSLRWCAVAEPTARL